MDIDEKKYYNCNCLEFKFKNRNGDEYTLAPCCILKEKRTGDNFYCCPLFCMLESKNSFKIGSPICCIKQENNSYTAMSPFCCYKSFDNGDIDILSPIFVYSKNRDKECFFNPIFCYSKNRLNKCFFSPLFCRIKNNKIKIVCYTCLLSLRCNNYKCDFLCLDYLLSNEDIYQDYYCSLCFCKYNKKEYVSGDTKNIQINEYIKKNKLKTQKYSYLKCFFVTFSKDKNGPPSQKMTDSQIESIIIRDEISNFFYIQGGDGDNTTQIIFDYLN
jgi:hypothetical protein